MPLIALGEVIDAVIMTLAIGFIFSDVFPRRTEGYDPLARRQRFGFIDWEALKYGAMAAAPGVILHELAHKFVAMSFGLEIKNSRWLYPS